MKRIFSFTEMIDFLEVAHNGSDMFTVTTGVYDGLHGAHVRYLQKAKNIRPTNKLIVGIFSDELTFKRKQKFPVSKQRDRAETIAELRCVDFIVVLTTKEETYAFIEAANPTHLVVSKTTEEGDYSAETMEERFKKKTAVVVLDSQGDVHSSDWLK